MATVDERVEQVLLEDPRATHRQVAELLEISESSARARVHRVLADGRVRPTVFVHPDVEGTGVAHLLRIGVEAGRAPEDLLAEPVLAPSPWAARVLQTGELLVQLSAPGVEEMGAGMRQVRALPGVADLECVVVLQVYVGDAWPADGRTHAWARTPEREVDALDRAAIACLRVDGRISYTALAAQIGLTVPAARKRVLRLVQDGIIRFAAHRDLGTQGCEAAVDLQVAAGAVAGLVEDLCRRPDVRYVVEQTGAHAVSCYVVAADEPTLAEQVGGVVADPRVRASRVDVLQVLRDDVSWTAVG